MVLIESPQRQKTSIAGDLATGKIRMDGLLTVEGERELWENTCIKRWMLRKGMLGVQTQCSSTF